MGIVVMALFMAFMSGYFLAFWQYRYEKLRNLALRAEIVGMRNRVYPVEPDPRTDSRCIPNMPWWGRVFLGFLWRLVPEAVKYNQFHINTLKNWADKVTRPSTYIILLKNFANKQKAHKDQLNKKRGRPKVEQYLVELILHIKKENPGYGPARISRMLKSDINEFVDVKTIRRILRSSGYPNNPRHKISPLRYEPAWKALIKNQFACGMDFKSIIDLMGNQLFILVIVHHSRSCLKYIAATYNPTSDWVAQQLREAFPYDTAPKYMLLDRDTIFLPVINQTLPNMGIKVRRTDYKCPWQNGVAERFILSLQKELLDLITPINADHMNRLLGQYKEYYNHARPHMSNDGYPPVLKPVEFKQAEKSVCNLESIPWVGGFHHSYRWAA